MRGFASRSWRAQRGIVPVGILLVLGSILAGAENGSDRLSFSLEEVSGFDVVDLGSTCLCRNEPDPNVTYPAFCSAKPLYGVIHVDGGFATAGTGTPYPFAIDESSGTDSGYDRLYLDLNRDGRLSDETPIEPLRELPEGALFKVEWVAPPVWFDYVTFSSTDVRGTHSIRALPRLLIGKEGYAILSFTATKALKGRIQIAGHTYNMTILNRSPLGTHWDRAGTVVKLESPSGVPIPSWYGSDRLMAMHKIDGQYWRFSITPEGDRFFVEPYRGDFGTLTLGSARWFAWKKGIDGSLFAQDKAILLAGDAKDRPQRTYQVPVGDYRPAILGIQYGPLRVSIGGSLGRESAAYPLRVRKDRPCVLDFSNEAQVLFVQPQKDTHIKPGDMLAVSAVLVDPKLGIMIQDLRRKPLIGVSLYLVVMIGAVALIPVTLWRLGRKAWRRSWLLPVLSVVGLLVLAGSMGALYVADAMLHASESRQRGYEPLNPAVTIARANGQIVAEGVMPFG